MAFIQEFRVPYVAEYSWLNFLSNRKPFPLMVPTIFYDCSLMIAYRAWSMSCEQYGPRCPTVTNVESLLPWLWGGQLDQLGQPLFKLLMQLCKIIKLFKRNGLGQRVSVSGWHRALVSPIGPSCPGSLLSIIVQRKGNGRASEVSNYSSPLFPQVGLGLDSVLLKRVRSK